ncbi:MAG: molybdopterin-dependent oxidoreductase [Polymorphobacter sp.]
MILLAALAISSATSVPIDAAARAGLPRATATLAVHGTQQRCEGVWLADLLARAGVPAGDAVKGDALASVVIAEAADGYRVVFSLGEIDRKLGKAPVLVADHCAGNPLAAADGPLRLVVPGDARGARSVRQLVRVHVQIVSP